MCKDSYTVDSHVAATITLLDYTDFKVLYFVATFKLTRAHLLLLLCMVGFGTTFDKRTKEACSQDRTGKQEMNNSHVV